MKKMEWNSGGWVAGRAGSMWLLKIHPSGMIPPLQHILHTIISYILYPTVSLQHEICMTVHFDAVQVSFSTIFEVPSKFCLLAYLFSPLESYVRTYGHRADGSFPA